MELNPFEVALKLLRAAKSRKFFFLISGNLKRKELNFAEIMLVHFYIFFLPELVYFPSFTD